MKDTPNADLQTIGGYLGNLIDAKYSSRRQFATEYCTKFDSVNRTETMENAISKICKNERLIPSDYLLGFSNLLGVSCEEILSAGEIRAPFSSRLTNYSVSGSSDASVWETYINDENQPFLQSDEYGKTVLDYALEFKNYVFLKYLLEKEIIWFAMEDEIPLFSHSSKPSSTFTVGTRIKPRFRQFYIDNQIEGKNNLPQGYALEKDETNPLLKELLYRKNLRTEILSMAIENNDLEVIKKLRGRELPNLPYQYAKEDLDASYSQKFIDALASSNMESSEIIDYFTEEYSLAKTGRILQMIFPYTKEWIKALIEQCHSCQSNHETHAVFVQRLNSVIDKVYSYQHQVFRELKEIAKAACQYYYVKNMQEYAPPTGDPVLDKIARERVFHSVCLQSQQATKEAIRLDTQTGFLSILGLSSENNMTSKVPNTLYIFNLVSIGIDKNNKAFQSLPADTQERIQQLNDSYQKIINFEPQPPKEQ